MSGELKNHPEENWYGDLAEKARSRPFDPTKLDPDYKNTEEDRRRYRRYKVRKAILAIVQGVALTALIGFTLYVVFNTKEPEPLYPPREQWTQRDGFVALSYGGLARKDRMDRKGNRSVSRETFERQMRALIDAGYHIITTEDVVNFYWKGAPLPDKALYLMFEGGRKDSAIFSQNTLKKLNLRATMFIQTARLTRGDRFFIRTTELGVLAKNPYWEIGSQGYELRYINPTEDGGYSFFLTDYLRDEYRDPIETDEELQARLEEDYELSFRPIEKYAEIAPQAYIFMPANMLWRSLEGKVEEINARLLDEYYRIVYAREGLCYNSSGTAPFNLTRMQVGAEWSINRLLMEIESSSPNRHAYLRTEEGGDFLWHTERGALLLEDGGLFLSAPADEDALAWLRGSDVWDNLDATVYFRGGARGEQKLYLRYNSHQSNICVTLSRNVLTVEEAVPRRGIGRLAQIPIDPELDSARSILPGDPSARAVRLRFTLIGNRLAVRAGEQERLLTSNAIPVSNLLRQGRIALGALGEDEPYDAVFERLTLRPIDQLWVQPLPEAAYERFAQDPSPRTCVVAPVPGGEEWERNGPRILYQALAEGKMAFAQLPDGTFDTGVLRRPWPSMPEGMLERFLSGVVLTPGDDPDWLAVGEASAAIAASGLQVALRLSAETARSLAESEVAPHADWIVYNFSEPLPEELDIRLKARYNRRYFLRLSADAPEGIRSYTQVGEGEE